MTEQNTIEFIKLLDQASEKYCVKPGQIIRASVVSFDGDYAVVDAGLKSEAYVKKSEFKENAEGGALAIGSEYQFMVLDVGNNYGETSLSREKAVKFIVWESLAESFKNSSIVTGRILERVKGGFTVDVKGIKAFLPGSLVDVRPLLKDDAIQENQEFEFKIVKMDHRRNNLVVSRKSVLDAQTPKVDLSQRTDIAEGKQITGVVKNITDYGVFVDLGGVDGLLHITDISWKRLKHPSDMLKIGEEITVKVLHFEKEKNRVSLGLKQLAGDPWEDISQRYPVGSKVFGIVTNITDYGAFVELEEGIEGLVHVSEMSWTNKNIHPTKAVQLGDELEVMVLEVDAGRRRISLGLKQCQTNPWQQFSDRYSKGDHLDGVIKSIADFGVFVELESGIDGLIHLNDLSWVEVGEKVINDYSKGMEIKVIILNIDVKRERISLGHKQLVNDPIAEYLSNSRFDESVEAKVIEANSSRVILELENDIKAILKSSESKSDHYELGQTVPVYLVDRKNCFLVVSTQPAKVISDSLKHSQTEQDSTAMRRQAEEEPAQPTLGDIVRDQLDKRS